ncbi:MAG TPA: hypothetical protein DDY13_07645 [Cytophagales bacterium]|jgi:hypothetical protein|nr:hypothetical protein [Cytophagales bacterium]
MRELQSETDIFQLHDLIGEKINKHLDGLDQNKSADSQKILELCQIGKLLSSYFNNYDIIKVSENPDFLISDGDSEIGLEHQLVLDPKLKSKEGFFDNIVNKVEEKLRNDKSLPGNIINLVFRDEINFKINDKSLIINDIANIIKCFVNTGKLKENKYILNIHKIDNSKICINANFGAYMQKEISPDLIYKFLLKKEEKVDSYRMNSVQTQWLILVIGSLGESSYELNREIEMNIQTKFDKVFIYEDLRNRLFEFK